jgi:hypothetical protein
MMFPAPRYVDISFALNSSIDLIATRFAYSLDEGFLFDTCYQTLLWTISSSTVFIRKKVPLPFLIKEKTGKSAGVTQGRKHLKFADKNVDR